MARRPTVAERFTELTSDRCGRRSKPASDSRSVRSLTPYTRKIENLAKYGTVGPSEEVNFRRCGRMGKVFRPPLRVAKQSRVRSKSHPTADVRCFEFPPTSDVVLSTKSEGLKLGVSRRCGSGRHLSADQKDCRRCKRESAPIGGENISRAAVAEGWNFRGSRRCGCEDE